MSFGPAPPLKHFSDEKYRAMLTTLREKVAPILANNLSPHLTEHGVAHSDSVTKLVERVRLRQCERFRHLQKVLGCRFS
jgi:hypothetical protein